MLLPSPTTTYDKPAFMADVDGFKYSFTYFTKFVQELPVQDVPDDPDDRFVGL